MTTILLVEDNDDIREAVAELLHEDGYEVCQAENGQVALEQLQQMQQTAGRPSLMLLDMAMPVMGGAELLQQVRQTQPWSRIPVIVLSAHGDAAEVPSVNRFMRKPIDYEQLLRSVDELTGRTAKCVFADKRDDEH